MDIVPPNVAEILRETSTDLFGATDLSNTSSTIASAIMYQI